MATGAIATVTLLGAIAFVVLIICNWYFFHKLDMSFLEWLRKATSKQRFLVLFDIVMSVALALEFLATILFII